MRKILFVVVMALGAVSVETMRAEAGCGGMGNPCGGKVMPKPPQPGLSIPFVAPKVGETETTSEDESMKGTLTMGGKSSPVEEATSQTYTKQVLAVAGDAATKVKVVVKAAHASSSAMGMKQDMDLPIKGKSYVASFDSGKTTVKGDKGADAPTDEAKLLGKIVESLGQPDAFAKKMAGMSFTKGQAVPLSAEDLATMMGSAEGMTAKDVSLTLSESDGKIATFEMKGSFSGKENGMDIAITFTATAKVDIKKSRPLSMAMTGDITGSGDMGQQGKVQLIGKMTAHKTSSFK